MQNFRCWVEVDTGRIKHNYGLISGLLQPNCKIMAVVKADAYGHGAVHAAWALESAGCENFAVTTLEEALELRKAGIKGAILILSSTPPNCTHLIAANNLTQSVCSFGYASALNNCAVMQGIKVKTHVKIDSGMRRLGFDNIDQLLKLETCQNLIYEGIYTHFSNSPDKKSDYTFSQWLVFSKFLEQLDERKFNYGFVHCCNSAAVINAPYAHCDFVRCGLMLYGAYPCGCDLELLPAMSFKTIVTDIRQVVDGGAVGYGCTYKAQGSRRIATIALGYADGYPWSLSNCGEMTINRRVFKVAGRVCMDNTMLQVDETVEVGDEVVVWGSGGVSIEDAAIQANTCAYELMCRISSRVKRIYK